MNTAAQELGRMGGRVKSERKAEANRQKARAYWAAIKSGAKPAPQRGKRGHNKVPD